MFFSVAVSVSSLIPSKTVHADDSVQHLIFYPSGLFKNNTDCLAVLPTQEKLFQQQTGLIPISSSCVPCRQVDQDDPLRFSPQIDFTGALTKYLYYADTFTTIGLQNSPQSISFLQQLIQDVGTIAIQTQDEIVYYRSEPPEISDIELASFRNASECTGQLDAVRAAYLQGGVSIIADCFTDNLSSFTTLAIAWTSQNTTVAEDHAFNSPVYSSYSDCMSAQGAFIAQKRAALPAGKHIWGDVCIPHQNAQADDDGYAIDLLSDNF